MHDEIGGDRGLSAMIVEGDVVAVAAAVHGDDLGVAAHVDVDGVAAGDEEFDEVGVEAAQSGGGRGRR
ncbi:MAG: hypothetical protein R2696_16145 [Microthrixaceae bacterium]